MRVAPGQQGIAAGGTGGRTRIEVGELHAVGSHPVEVGVRWWGSMAQVTVAQCRRKNFGLWRGEGGSL